MSIILKDKESIILLYEAGQMVARVFAGIVPEIREGMTTADLNQRVHELILENGCRPAFLGYLNYPASACISINEEVVHGIPSAQRRLKSGDLVSLDIGVQYRGVYGDAARTVPVGKISRTAKRLLRTGRECLRRAISVAQPGNRMGDISHAIQSHAESQGFNVIRDWVGHGIGERLHEEPQVPNFGEPGQGPLLQPGLVICLEPMVNAGTWKMEVQADGWTVVTGDRKLSVHFEDTVALLPTGNVILTEPDESGEVRRKIEKCQIKILT